MITKISYEKGAKPTKFTLKKSEFEYNVKDETLYTIGKQGELITIVSVKSITDAFLAVDGALTANADALTAHKNLKIMRRTDAVTRTFGTTYADGKIWDTFYKTVGTDVMLSWRVPFRNSNSYTTWGGGYIEIYISINGGAWASLGSSGYDGGVMVTGAGAIGSMSGTLLIDLQTVRDASFIRLKFQHRSYDNTLTVNGSHDIYTGSIGAFWSQITLQEVDHVRV